MKLSLNDIKAKHISFALYMVAWLTFFFIIPSGPPDTMESTYSVDTSCLGTYFPISTITDTVYKNYTLTISNDQIVERRTDRSGRELEHLKSDFLKIYETYTYKEGQQYEVFCFDAKGRIIKFLMDEYSNSDRSKYISKYVAHSRKPNQKLEDLNYEKLYSENFTMDTTIFEKQKQDSAMNVSKY